MLIYLAASLDPRMYKQTHELLRQLGDALQREYKHRCVYPHGHTLAEADPVNKTQPGAAEMVSLCHRMLSGDGLLHPRPDAVWAVGTPDETVRDQMALAETLRLPVGSIDEDEVEDLLAKHEPPVVVPVDIKAQRWGATRVLSVFFAGGEGLCGVRGLPMEPRVGGSSAPAYRLDNNATQLAYAAAVVRRACLDSQWDELMLPLLCLLVRDGHTLHRAADLCSLGGRGRHAREVRAQKLRDKAMGCIYRAIVTLENADVE